MVAPESQSERPFAAGQFASRFSVATSQTGIQRLPRFMISWRPQAWEFKRESETFGRGHPGHL